MTITNTTLGNHTTQITLSGETNLTNFITQLDAAIVAGGWSQYDVSNQYNRIYRCLNADGSTYKLIGIYIDPATFKMSTTSYESWNTSTHVGTNQTFTYNRAGTMGLAVNLCDVIVMVSSRYLFLQTFINNQMSPWAGVVEIAREMPEDTVTAAYPCWCWVSSVTIFSTTGDNNRPFVSLPRTVSGATGAAACANLSLMLPNALLGTTYGTATANLNILTTYGWNASDTLVQQAKLIVNNIESHGQLFGLKFVSNIGSPYNQIAIPVDSNLNYLAGGTSTNHWVMGANPNTNSNVNILANTGAGASGYAQLSTVAMTACFAAVPVGTGWYVTNSSGTYTVSTTGTTLGTPALITGTAGVCQDIVYDGVQYVYVAGPSGVLQINTTNSNSVASLAITGGCSTLFFDGTYLWASTRGTATSNKVTQITCSTFTVANTINLGNATSAYIGGMCSDYQGNTYVTTSEPKVYKIVNSSSTVSAFYTMTGTAGYSVGITYNGDYLVAVSSTGSSVTTAWLSSTGTLIGSTYTTGSSLNTAGSLGWAKLTLGKMGVYDFVSGTYSNTYGITLQQPNATGTASTAFLYTTAAGCDGNKVWICQSGANTFNVLQNFYHPDEASTTFGRILIPT